MDENEEGDEQEHEPLDTYSDSKLLCDISNDLISKVCYLQEADDSHESEDSVDLADTGESGSLAYDALVKDLVEGYH